MRDIRKRVHRLETQRLAALVAAINAELARFAAFYGPERARAPFDQVLAPFTDAQLEVLCAAMEAQHTGAYAGLTIPDLEALIIAFRRHNEEAGYALPTSL